MRRESPTNFPVLETDLQLGFHYRLQALRDVYLAEALSRAVVEVGVPPVDAELAQYVEAGKLAKVASFGCRGERFFPVPSLLRANPYLLGYYRLLYGFSQKMFYSGSNYGRFRGMEERGEIRPEIKDQMDALCQALCGRGGRLLPGPGSRGSARRVEGGGGLPRVLRANLPRGVPPASGPVAPAPVGVLAVSLCGRDRRGLSPGEAGRG